MSVGSARPLVATTGWAMGSYVAAAGLQLRATGYMEVSLRALVVCLRALSIPTFSNTSGIAMRCTAGGPIHGMRHTIDFSTEKGFGHPIPRHYERSLRAGTSSRCY